MNWRNKALAFACFTALLNGPAVAANVDLLKVGMPGDTTDVLPVMRSSRLVTFRYNDEASFAIRAMLDTYVNVEVPEGEVIQGFYLSDPTQWTFHVTGDNRRVLVMPQASGLVNTGTMVTDRRSYELTMISVPPGEMWFQRVRWQIPGTAGALDGHYWSGQAAGTGGAKDPDPATLDPSALHFGYKIKGRESFRPTAVFDDGIRTWIKFGKVQDLPAIFALRGGQMEVVDYSVQGQYVVIPAVSDTFILRLRKDEVRLERKG